MQNSKFKIQKWLSAFCILNSAFLISSCGVPNLESVECSEARVAAKKFLSFHFGNDMEGTVENVKLRERFLTPKFFQESLAQVSELSIDPFTGSKPTPTTFKVGKCLSAGREADFEVQYYWRSEASTQQRPTIIALVKQDDQWLVNMMGKIP